MKIICRKFAKRIEEGDPDFPYSNVPRRLKDGVDAILKEDGFVVNADGTVTRS